MKQPRPRRLTRGQRHAAAAAKRTGWCACGKTSFNSVAAARRTKHDAEIREGDPMRIYACPNKARTWHLTSQGRDRGDDA